MGRFYFPVLEPKHLLNFQYVCVVVLQANVVHAMSWKFPYYIEPIESGLGIKDKTKQKIFFKDNRRSSQ